MYIRYLENLVLDLLKEFRIIYLTGPRQAGKTTLTRSIANKLNMKYITLDDQATLSSILNDPHGYVRSLGPTKVVLDEFQYAPDIIPAIKEASDALPSDEKGKFLLTGSSDIFRSAKTAQSLPGHMARLELLTLSLSEITNQPFNIIDYLLTDHFQYQSLPISTREQVADKVLYGGYPEIQNKSQKARSIWFKSYVEGRLFKDFETLYAARGDYYSRLTAMAPYLAGLSGNLLKYANVANDLDLNDKVVKNYIEILELMFIVRRLPAFIKNSSKRLTTMPKLHFIDTGLACHLLGLKNANELLASQFYGGLLENMVFLELTKQSSWADEEVSIFHYRDKNKNEVDFVLERDNGTVYAIEVKASSTPKREDFKGMATLAETIGKKFKSGFLFYTGHEVLPFNIGDHSFHAIPIGLLG